MNDNNEPSFTRSRVKKNSNKVLYLFIVTILALTGGFFFYQKNIESFEQRNSPYNDSMSSKQDEESVDTDQNSSPEGPPPISQSPISAGDSNQQMSNTLQSPSSAPQRETNIASSAAATENRNDAINSHPSTTAFPSTAQNQVNYNLLISELNAFYTHLDNQQYMQDFNLPESSKEHFSKLIQKLIDNPPVVARETDDLFTLLKNTAHFFRIIGKENILVLKGILDREKDSFESILQSLYQLTDDPNLLKEQYGITLSSEALYDYAGFFLNTMGGRLYLFRRDSNSRLAVSYYAILIIDRANDAGNSRNGIDIRPAVDSLIEEIENGGKNLKLREAYLDKLYDLKVKYD